MINKMTKLSTILIVFSILFLTINLVSASTIANDTNQINSNNKLLDNTQVNEIQNEELNENISINTNTDDNNNNNNNNNNEISTYSNIIINNTKNNETDTYPNSNKIATSIESNNYSSNYKSGETFNISLIDENKTTIANQNITMILSNSYGDKKNYTLTTDNYGQANLNISLSPGNYSIKTVFEGTNIYNSSEIINSVIIKTNTSIISSDFDEAYGNDNNFTISLVDMNNQILANQTIIFTITNNLNETVNYTKTTDKFGIAILTIDLNKGNYTIKTLFNGTEKYGLSEALNSIIISDAKLQAILSSETFVENYGEGKNFTVRLSDANENPIVGMELALKLINNLGDFKVYWATTNTEGVAKLQINLIPSNYTIETSFYGNDIYSKAISNSSVLVNNLTNTSKYTLTVLNWESTGDITKNTVLMNNIQSTDLNNEIIKACKEGTPLVKFGNGNGPTIFINAGVHGNELASQAAAFRLVNALNELNYEINGTIYIIPVLCPTTTADNTRYYNGVNLNSVANKAGTLSNNLVNLALSLDSDVLGDFHCTMVGGDPGKNIAMGTYSPQAESATLAKYISKRTGYAYLIYDVAGTEYPGAVEDVANLNGLTSVTCEALTNHGTIATGSVTVSYNMMTALLDYYSLLL